MIFLNQLIDKSKKSVYNKGNRRILKEKYFRRIQHSTNIFCHLLVKNTLNLFRKEW